MAYHLYPLTASQRMLQNACEEFGTTQVLTIGVCVSIRMPVDFSLLKACLTEETERLDCLRVQLTSPDREGGIRQYIVPEHTPDITYRNLKDKTKAEIKDLMTSWSTIGFEKADAPLHRYVMVSLPGGFNGVYLCIDHRIMDSAGLISMMNDTFRLYCHYLYGAPVPAMPARYEEVLQSDLKREQDSLRQEKDLAFWKQLLTAGEPVYTDFGGSRTLEQSRLRHGMPGLGAAERVIQPMEGDMARFTLSKKETARLQSFCREHSVSMTNLFLMSMRTALSFTNGEERDVTIRNYISRRTSRQSRTCGGCRIHCYPCRTVISPDTPFLSGIRQITSCQNSIYRHSNMDPETVNRLFADTFPMPPLTTYEGAALTYQPLPLSSSNPWLNHIPLRTEWFSNRADIQKLYLTVMQTSCDQGLDFYFKYQKAELGKSDIDAVYELLSAVLSLGVRRESLPVGELMRQL